MRNKREAKALLILHVHRIPAVNGTSHGLTALDEFLLFSDKFLSTV